MLTDERIVDLRRTTGPASGYTQWADTIGFARAIEAEVRKEQEDKIAELERQLAEARKDSERLDYLQSKSRSDPKMDGNHVWWPTTFNVAQSLKGPTLRAAIDAAIKSKEQQNG